MPKDNSRRAASGGIRTHNVLRTRQTLYQLSHRGSSAGQAESLNVIQGQRYLFPDKQGNSFHVGGSDGTHSDSEGWLSPSGHNSGGRALAP